MNMNRNAGALKNQRVLMICPAGEPMIQPGTHPQCIYPTNAVDERVNLLRNTMQSLNPAYIESLSDDKRRNVFDERLFTVSSAIGY